MSPRIYTELHRLKPKSKQHESARTETPSIACSARLAGEKAIPEKHRRYLHKLIGESRAALAAHPQRQPSVVLLDKLVDASNGGARSSDSDIVPLLGSVAIPRELADPAFDRYVDLRLLGRAWNTGNAMLMTDAASNCSKASEFCSARIEPFRHGRCWKPRHTWRSKSATSQASSGSPN